MPGIESVGGRSSKPGCQPRLNSWETGHRFWAETVGQHS